MGFETSIVAESWNALPFGEVSRKWDALVGLTTYMRSTEPPSEANIAAAQRLFESLGVATRVPQRHVLRRSRQDLPSQAILWQQPPLQPGADQDPAAAAALGIGPPSVRSPASAESAAAASAAASSSPLLLPLQLTLTLVLTLVLAMVLWLVHWVRPKTYCLRRRSLSLLQRASTF